MMTVVLAFALALALAVLIARDQQVETTTMDPITVQQGEIVEP